MSRYIPKRQQLEATAAAMRVKYLTTGRGCKTRAKVIAGRTRPQEAIYDRRRP